MLPAIKKLANLANISTAGKKQQELWVPMWRCLGGKSHLEQNIRALAPIEMDPIELLIRIVPNISFCHNVDYGSVIDGASLNLL